MKLSKFLIIILSLLFLASFTVLAQDVDIATSSAKEDIQNIVNLDENITSQDLGIPEPTLLPDSPFYFLKEWARSIQEGFTFDSVKKAELRLRFANEKLIEVKKLSEKTDEPNVIKKAVNNYQMEMEKIKNRVEKIKDTAESNLNVNNFLNKFIDQQTLHEKLLQKLENQVPPEVFEKIQEAREEHLEKFQEIMLKLEDKENISSKLDEVLESQKGSQFKEFKNLEVLKNLENKVPEEAKQAIQQAQVNALKRLQGDLEKMSPEDQAKFKEYLNLISGDKTKQLEIIEGLKTQFKIATSAPAIIYQLKQKIEEGKAEILENIGNESKKMNCPLWTTPSLNYCTLGKIYIGKDENGCPLPPKCLITNEINIACITLWNPVCGKDGKTYSNSCFAKLAGTEVDYEGACSISNSSSSYQITPSQNTSSETPIACAQVIIYCFDLETGECKTYPDACSGPKPCQSCQKETPPTSGGGFNIFSCKQYWWFDSENNACQQKTLCGLFMYLGLRTFDSQAECEVASK